MIDHREPKGGRDIRFAHETLKPLEHEGQVEQAFHLLFCGCGSLLLELEEEIHLVHYGSDGEETPFTKFCLHTWEIHRAGVTRDRKYPLGPNSLAAAKDLDEKFQSDLSRRKTFPENDQLSTIAERQQFEAEILFMWLNEGDMEKGLEKVLIGTVVHADFIGETDQATFLARQEARLLAAKACIEENANAWKEARLLDDENRDKYLAEINERLALFEGLHLQQHIEDEDLFGHQHRERFL